MPCGYCPCCGATYDSPTLTSNGPFCRFCLPRGDIVVMLPVGRRRFARTRSRNERHAVSWDHPAVTSSASSASSTGESGTKHMLESSPNTMFAMPTARTVPSARGSV